MLIFISYLLLINPKKISCFWNQVQKLAQKEWKLCDAFKFYLYINSRYAQINVKIKSNLVFHIMFLTFCRLMNGIIEYDQKLTSLPKFFLIRQISPKIIYWNIIFIITLIYYITITSVFLYLWPPKTIDFTTIAVYNIIRLELIVDVSVLLCSYFFLQQLEYRFQVLNNTWAHLLPRFHSNSGDCTYFITGMTRDKVRLLQAELSDLLRIFSDGYRKVLLGYFMYWYCNMVLGFFFNFFFSIIRIS